MASLFEAYITNLGKYNEGELVGETLKFPTSTQEVQGLLKRIGVACSPSWIRANWRNLRP